MKSQTHISTHDLTRRSTRISGSLVRRPIISTHDLTRRSTLSAMVSETVRQISTHDLTRRSTITIFVLSNIIHYFNSRPHEEVDGLQNNAQTADKYFNSRPHEEVDAVFLSVAEYKLISTHDLTRRSTSVTEYL